MPSRKLRHAAENVLVMFAFPAMSDHYYYRTAKVGQTVKFPCRTKLLEAVNWERLDTRDSKKVDIYDGFGGLIDLGLDPRFTVLDKTHSHSLVIYNVTVDDSAYYQCVEDAGLGNKHFYRVIVEGIVLFSCCCQCGNYFVFFILQFKTFALFSNFSKFGPVISVTIIYFKQ